jgi:hypothetical protein
LISAENKNRTVFSRNIHFQKKLLIKTPVKLILAGFFTISFRIYGRLWQIDSRGQARGNLPSEYLEREGEAPRALPVEGAT